MQCHVAFTTPSTSFVHIKMCSFVCRIVCSMGNGMFQNINVFVLETPI